jgi:RNA recognition motif-containing protein
MAKTLYVGNLPYSATEADLFDHFKEFDPLTARIIEGRGFGFIEVNDDQMDAAIEAKHNSEMGGRRLTVNEARPKPDRGGGGGGGGYRDRDDRGKRW